MNQAVATFRPSRLPWHPGIAKRFKDIGVTEESWRALVESCYPAAKSVDSVLMVLSYCQARKLDPFKRPVHIVPIWDSQSNRLVDTVWQGISELRTTAIRTGQYAGTDPMEFGPMVTRTFTDKVKRGQNWVDVKEEVTYPEWARLTIYRLVRGVRTPFSPPPVYWEEAYACEGRSEIPNAMWRKRARGQLAKCCEAAALRFAFPEEVGNEYAAEEMEGQRYYGAENAKDVTPPKQTASDTLDHFSGAPASQEPAIDDAEVIDTAPDDFDLPEPSHPEMDVMPDRDDEPDPVALGERLCNGLTNVGTREELMAWDERTREAQDFLKSRDPEKSGELDLLVAQKTQSFMEPR